MSTLLVSQGVTNHSRIGNTLLLARNLRIWQRRTNFNFYFPFPSLKFPEYINEELAGYSYTFDGALDVASMLATILPRQVRLEMVRWEKKNHKNPYEFPDDQLIIRESDFFRCPIIFNYKDTKSHREEIESCLSKTSLVIVHDPYPWSVENPSESEYELAAHLLKPSSKLESDICKWLADRGIRDHSFIAIHARLGDYQQWNSGRYFFGKEYYMELATRITESYPGVPVLVFSNEELGSQVTSDDIYFPNLSPDSRDFCLMQRARLIVAPPSTFSGLAAEIGRSKSKSEYPNIVHIHSNCVEPALHDIKNKLER